MKKISYWAKHNPRLAQIIIAISELMLFILSVILGVLLLQSHIMLHEKFAQVALLLVAVSLTCYPYKSSPQKKYALRKSMEFILGSAIFMLGCFMANRDKIVEWNTYPALQGHYVSLYKTETKLIPANKSITKKQLRKEAKAWMKKEKKENKNSSLNWLWITLIVLGGIALLMLVVAAACSIGCAGDLTGAWLVGLGGSALVIFLMYLGIHGITKNNKKRLKEQSAGNRRIKQLEV